MNGFLIPANTKKSSLIFGLFNVVDLVIFVVGVGLTLLLLLFLSSYLNNLFTTIMMLMPGTVAAFLVIPVPNYHNIRTYFTSMIQFFMNRRRFIWKGWCVLGGPKEEE